jgi:uncharacterized caspase-like protein
MAKNWAIVVGINQYNPNNFARLKYAKRDAELMRDFFREAEFDEVYYFADDSPDLVRPDGTEIPTYPSCGNLLSFLHDRFEKPFLSTGDNLWFFFAGHGGRYRDRDYLMPIDANPRGNEPTAAILVGDVRDRLCRCGADNVILILDACRNEGSRDGQGVGNEHQQGVITTWSCSPTQRSWEIDELQQGAFTYALLEALRISGERNCATVERLGKYLRHRVPELCRHYDKIPEQNPRISIDPETKIHFILLPHLSTFDQDIKNLKHDAYRSAQVDNNLELAEQLWRRIIAVTDGGDEEALQAFSQIRQQRERRSSSSAQSRPVNEVGSERSINSVPSLTPTPRQENTHPASKSDTSVASNSSKSRQAVGNFSPVLKSRPKRSYSVSTRSSFQGSSISSETTIPWGWIVGCILSYGSCGILLAKSPTILLAWIVVAAVVVASIVFIASAILARARRWLVILAVIMAVAVFGTSTLVGVWTLVLAMAGTLSFAWAVAGTIAWVVAGTIALSIASVEILQFFKG